MNTKSGGKRSGAKKQKEKSFFARHRTLFIGIPVAVVVFVVIASFVLASLNSARNRSFSAGAPEMGVSDGSGGFSLPNADADYASEPPRGGGSEEADLPIGERKVIKNAYLDLVVSDTEEAAEAISATAVNEGGFVADVRIYEASNDTKRGNITIRVPSTNFGGVIDTIKRLAIQVEDEKIETRDVTTEYIDLSARLRTNEALETELIELLDEAESIEEILQVRAELQSVRQTIERLEGRIMFLSRQINLSTVTVSLVSEADVEIFGIAWSPISEIKAGARDMIESLVGFADMLIAFVFFLPAILLWLAFILLILYILSKIVRVTRRRLRAR